MVALALYSKCITVAEAILVLLDAGFSDEAFGSDAHAGGYFPYPSYITNKDTDERANRYAQFAAKNSAVWAEVVQIYWPARVQPLPERTQLLAATFPSPHSWSGKTVKEMAWELDTVEVAIKGTP